MGDRSERTEEKGGQSLQAWSQPTYEDLTGKDPNVVAKAWFDHCVARDAWWGQGLQEAQQQKSWMQGVQATISPQSDSLSMNPDRLKHAEAEAEWAELRLEAAEKEARKLESELEKSQMQTRLARSEAESYKVRFKEADAEVAKLREKLKETKSQRQHRDSQHGGPYEALPYESDRVGSYVLPPPPPHGRPLPPPPLHGRPLPPPSPYGSSSPTSRIIDKEELKRQLNEQDVIWQMRMDTERQKWEQRADELKKDWESRSAQNKKRMLEDAESDKQARLLVEKDLLASLQTKTIEAAEKTEATTKLREELGQQELEIQALQTKLRIAESNKQELIEQLNKKEFEVAEIAALKRERQEAEIGNKAALARLQVQVDELIKEKEKLVLQETQLKSQIHQLQCSHSELTHKLTRTEKDLVAAKDAATSQAKEDSLALSTAQQRLRHLEEQNKKSQQQILQLRAQAKAHREESESLADAIKAKDRLQKEIEALKQEANKIANEQQQAKQDTTKSIQEKAIEIEAERAIALEQAMIHRKKVEEMEKRNKEAQQKIDSLNKERYDLMYQLNVSIEGRTNLIHQMKNDKLRDKRRKKKTSKSSRRSPSSSRESSSPERYEKTSPTNKKRKRERKQDKTPPAPEPSKKKKKEDHPASSSSNPPIAPLYGGHFSSSRKASASLPEMTGKDIPHFSTPTLKQSNSEEPA